MLEKAEQLLRAHEETAQSYMAKAREEATKAKATNTSAPTPGRGTFVVAIELEVKDAVGAV